MHNIAASSLNCTSSQGVQQLGSIFQGSFCLCEGHPCPRSLMHFGPLCFLPVDGAFEEMIRRLGCLCRQLDVFPRVRDYAQVVFDGADDAGLFPGFSLSGFLCGGLVRFPAAFRENPIAATCRLDEQDVEIVLRQGHKTGNESFSLCSVACGGVSFILGGAKTHHGRNREMRLAELTLLLTTSSRRHSSWLGHGVVYSWKELEVDEKSVPVI